MQKGKSNAYHVLGNWSIIRITYAWFINFTFTEKMVLLKTAPIIHSNNLITRVVIDMSTTLGFSIDVPIIRFPRTPNSWLEVFTTLPLIESSVDNIWGRSPSGVIIVIVCALVYKLNIGTFENANFTRNQPKKVAELKPINICTCSCLHHQLSAGSQPYPGDCARPLELFHEVDNTHWLPAILAVLQDDIL